MKKEEEETVTVGYAPFKAGLNCVFICVVAALMVVVVREEEYLGLRWGLWGVMVVCMVASGEWLTKQYTLKSLVKKSGVETERLKRLKTRQLEHHLHLREAMDDIIDTVLEKARNLIHHNKYKLLLEGHSKALLQDKAGDTIGALESNIHWGTEWPKLNTKWKNSVKLEFGSVMRDIYFDVKPGYLNVAEKGIIPRPVMQGRSQWDDSNQKNPVIWRFKSLPVRLGQTAARLAAVLGSDPNDTVLIANAEEGISAVVRGLPWEVADVIIYVTTPGETDLSFQNVAMWVKKNHGVEVRRCVLPLPCGEDAILRAVSGVMQRKEIGVQPPKLAMFHHVSSEGWVLPAERLTKLFHSRGVSVLINGSQAVGQRHVSVSKIACDWYAASCTKFMFGYGGSGVLVAIPLKHDCTFPLTVSYFDRKGFEKEFSYYGLRDFSSWLSLLDVCDFVDQVCGGWSNIRSYSRTLASQTRTYLSSQWSVTPLQPLTQPTLMPTFPIPHTLGHTTADAASLQSRLSTQGITVRVFSAAYSNAEQPSLYVTTSIGIHNSMADIEKLGAAVLNMRSTSHFSL